MKRSFKCRTWTPAFAGVTVAVGMHLGCLAMPALAVAFGATAPAALTWICGVAPGKGVR